MSRLRMGWVLLGLALAFSPALSTVHAATINVTTSDDEDNGNPPPAGSDKAKGSKGCSLREALQEIDLNNGVAYHGCAAATVNGPNTINLSGAGGTIIVNGLVPDPSDHANGTAMIRNGNLPNIFNASSIGAVTLTGGDITCAPDPDSEKIFIVAADGDFTLTGVTMHDCTAFGSGIAITSSQGGATKLTITGSNFVNIKGTSTGPGGAISHSGGNLTIGSSSFTSCGEDNGSGGGEGGALGIEGVSFPNFVTIDSTNFLNNTAGESGGAIYISGADGITISNDIFTTNSAGGDSSSNAEFGGGAIWAANAGKGGNSGITNFFLIFNSQFISNSASNGTGGAILLSSGDLSFGNYDFTDPKIPGGIVASNFTGNTAKGPAPSGIDPRSGAGGAIYAAANLSVLQSSFVSTIGANSSAHGSGGAIAFYDASGNLNPLALVNTTISGNKADQNGGAVADLLATTNQSGKAMLLNDTIDNNPANGTGGTVGGAFFNGNSTATDVIVSNTILSDTAGTGGNCTGQAFSGVTDLQFPGTTCGAGVPSADPKLQSPSIFTGPNVFVFTMALNAGSAASNAGTNSVCDAIPVFTFDGSGRPGIRPSPGGSNCDIGAYESSNAPVYASVPAPSATINMTTLTTGSATSTVVISNAGTDDLTISNFSTTGGPQIVVSGAATPFTIPVGSGTQTLTLTCSNATAGNFSGTLTVTHNAAGSPATYTVNCDVTAPAMPLTITTASPLPAASVGAAYSQTFAATGGMPPYTNWAITVGTLPSWASLDATTGALTGMPSNTLGSPFTFTVQVTDSASATTTKVFSLTVTAPPLVITTTSPLPNATVATNYSQPFAASGGVSPYSNWTVISGTKPSWATLDPTTGVISGLPSDTSGSPFSFVVQVQDSEAVTTSKTFVLTVSPPPISITTTSPLPTATVGVAYTQPFAATGGTPPYTNWSITAGTPPGWATLAAATGVLTGTAPNTAGSPFTFTVTVTDSASATASKVFALQVVPPAPSITTASPLPQATVNTLYTQPFAATGGTPPYGNWTVVGGAIPSWATLNAATGTLSGTPPDIAGSPFTFTIQTTDNAAVIATKVFTLTVKGSTPVTLQEFGVD